MKKELGQKTKKEGREEERGRGREKQGGERKSWRIAFWNIAGATNKDEEF